VLLDEAGHPSFSRRNVMMTTKLATLLLAGGLIVGTADLAGAQSDFGYYPQGCSEYGYYGGWGSAPPITAPHPACNSIPSYGASPACTGYPCPAGAAWRWGY
jgi:hypothetical protein